MFVPDLTHCPRSHFDFIRSALMAIINALERR